MNTYQISATRAVLGIAVLLVVVASFLYAVWQDAAPAQIQPQAIFSGTSLQAGQHDVVAPVGDVDSSVPGAQAVNPKEPPVQIQGNFPQNQAAGTPLGQSSSSGTQVTPPSSGQGINLPFLLGEKSKSKPVYTDRELFDWTWDPDYRSNLILVQDIMVSDGFMPASEKNTSLDSDEAVYKTLEKLFDYALAKNWISAQDAAKLRQGLTQLPRLVEDDRVILRDGGIPPHMIPGRQSFNRTLVDERSTVARLIDGMKYVITLFPEEAKAQVPDVPGWHTTPDCYKDLNPVFPVLGPNLWSFCCNCGLLCVGPYCEFIPDCGPYSAECNVPLGCLNLMCETWPNAIWDAFWYPGGTGICGCG